MPRKGVFGELVDEIERAAAEMRRRDGTPQGGTMKRQRTKGTKRRSTLTAEAQALAGRRTAAPAPPRAASAPGQRRRQLAPGDTERVALWLTRDVATRLRVHAAKHRMALSVVAEEALARYLEGE